MKDTTEILEELKEKFPTLEHYDRVTIAHMILEANIAGYKEARDIALEGIKNERQKTK